jgi:hypothetical protein
MGKASARKEKYEKPDFQVYSDQPNSNSILSTFFNEKYF